MTNVDFYKQGPGAIDVGGAAMDPGWYWVRTRPNATGEGPPIPYGKSTGPFKTKGEAERAYREQEKSR